MKKSRLSEEQIIGFLRQANLAVRTRKKGKRPVNERAGITAVGSHGQ